MLRLQLDSESKILRCLRSAEGDVDAGNDHGKCLKTMLLTRQQSICVTLVSSLHRLQCVLDTTMKMLNDDSRTITLGARAPTLIGRKAVAAFLGVSDLERRSART